MWDINHCLTTGTFRPTGYGFYSFPPAQSHVRLRLFEMREAQTYVPFLLNRVMVAVLKMVNNHIIFS